MKKFDIIDRYVCEDRFSVDAADKKSALKASHEFIGDIYTEIVKRYRTKVKVHKKIGEENAGNRKSE